jgi:hypothetical protein
MDQKEFNECTSRLQEVGKIIEKLPTEIRSEAFGLLKGYVAQQVTTPTRREGPAEYAAGSGEGADLFSRFDHDKPSDNVRLVAAYLFQEYGSDPFSLEEVKAVATNAGITIPDRVDMTLAKATENGKQLFTRVGRGKFKPTVHGEAFLKVTYGVKKGTKKREIDDK